MLDTQSIIIANVATVGLLGFFVRLWINGVNRNIEVIFGKLDKKVEDTLCAERRERLTDDQDDHCRKNEGSFTEVFSRIRAIETAYTGGKLG
jgi:hypothetical protein